MEANPTWSEPRKAALREVKDGKVRWGEVCGWQAPEHRRQAPLSWLEQEGYIAIIYGGPKRGKVMQTVPVAITAQGSMALQQMT